MDSMLSSLFSLSILLSRCLGTDVFNIMLSDAEQLENLSNTGGLNVVISTKITVDCPSRKSTYELYNLQKDDYDSCNFGGEKIVIGSCVNSPLIMDVKSTAIKFISQVYYEVGNTYYYGVFDERDPLPCKNGLKFQVNVVPPPEEVTTSSIVHAPSPSPSPSPYTSLIQSTSASSSVVHSSSSPMPNIKSSSSVSTIASTRGNIVTRPVRPSSTVATQPTEITRPTTDDPIIDGIRDGSPSSSSASFLLMVLLVLSIPLFHRLL